ncbi:MAG: RNA-binding protein [Alphaproteobacteria bacterium]
MTIYDNRARTTTQRKRRGLVTGRAAPASGAESGRRCIVSGEVVPRQQLIRFVVGPENKLIPDIAETLPGRGLWLMARRDVLNTALARSLFARAARSPVTVDADLADKVEGLLARRCLELLGLARRAGLVVTGFEKVRAMLGAGKAALLITAAGAAPGGRAKLRAMAPDVLGIGVLESQELAAALGRGHVVHVAVARSPLADRIAFEAGRLEGMRPDFSQDTLLPSAVGMAPDGTNKAHGIKES